MTDGLIAAHGEVEKLMPYLHLPVQSGSDRILKAMNRSHTAEAISPYWRGCARPVPTSLCPATSSSASRAKPKKISTATLNLVDEVGYASAYSFKYSPRPGTPAATMEDQIAPEVMDERLQRLHDRINTHQIAFNRASIGRETGVLIERKGRYPGQMIGKSPWLQSVHVETDATPGDIVEVTLTSAGPNSMSGSLTTKVAA